jgi:hypothetical protein
MTRTVKEKVRDLENAIVPTATLIHAFADAVAQYLASTTGGRVDIAMHGLTIISRVPAENSLKSEKL